MLGIRRDDCDAIAVDKAAHGVGLAHRRKRGGENPDVVLAN
jgi:hypothetical protein